MRQKYIEAQRHMLVMWRPVGGFEVAERSAVQLPRARCTGFFQKTSDLAREAVNCNAGLGGNLV